MEKQDNLKQGSILLGKETIERDYSGQMQSVYRIKINDGNQELRQEKEKLDKLGEWNLTSKQMIKLLIVRR